jgi:D-alanine-D-alanine ligase
MADKLRVGIIIGGRSVEHEISLLSGLQANFAINRNKYHVDMIYLSKQNEFYMGERLNHLETYQKDDYTKCDKVIMKKKNHQIFFETCRPIFKKIYPIDVFLPIVHGAGIEDGTLSGFLNLFDAIYTSSDLSASAISQDKEAAKLLAEKQGIATLDSLLLTKEDQEIYFDYPIIIKPVHLGSSIGIKVATNDEEKKEYIHEAFLYDDKILVEPYLEKPREFNCACLENKNELIVSMIEEVYPTQKILSFDDKYQNKPTKLSNASNRDIPAIIPKELEEEIKNTTKRLFEIYHHHGVVRMDYLYDNNKKVLYFNEVNTIPGSLAFYLFEKEGIDFSQLIDTLIRSAFFDHERKHQLQSHFSSNVLSCKSKKLS